MVVNGLRLPDAFERAVREGRTDAIYALKDKLDAYGNQLETEIGAIYSDEDSIARETEGVAGVRLNDQDKLDEIATEADPYANDPGFVPYITNFSKILCFGHAGDGSPFCFDFRENLQQPNVL